MVLLLPNIVFFIFNTKKMSRSHLLFVFLFTVSITASSQAVFTTITIKKKLQPGLVLQLPNNTDVAEGTILQKLKETGYSPETKGKLFWKKISWTGFMFLRALRYLLLTT